MTSYILTNAVRILLMMMYVSVITSFAWVVSIRRPHCLFHLAASDGGGFFAQQRAAAERQQNKPPVSPSEEGKDRDEDQVAPKGLHGGKMHPFDDDMYSHMTSAINTITKRMKKNGERLSPQDLDELDEAIRYIVADARQGVGLPLFATLAPTHDPEDENKNHFSEFNGQSSWVIPGMDDLSTEDYYQAVNKRIGVIKEKRKANGDPVGPQTVAEYERHLNTQGRRNEEDARE